LLDSDAIRAYPRNPRLIGSAKSAADRIREIRG
jgi:hypothetical protein